MTDDQIKQQLNGLTQLRWGPGKVAILHSKVEGAGCDLGEVRRWVEANGGKDDTVESPSNPGLRGGRMVGSPPRRDLCFVIPDRALF